MRTVALAFLAVLLSPLAASQEIYRWVDKDGIVHYSDQPGPGAERITISGSVTREPAESETPALYQSEPRPAATPGYQSISIASPAMDEAFFGTAADVEVSIALDGELQPGHEVALYLDGQRVGTDGLSATLSGVPRGTHYLQASVLDASGGTLVSSPQISFHVRQESIAKPPVGPNLRPKPPPKPAPKPTPKPAG